MLYWFVCTTVYIITKILFRFETYGIENIPEKGPFILASNHRSFLDPPIITVSTKRSLYFIAKAELFSNRFFSEFFKGIHCIKTDRKNVDRSVLKEGLRVLHRGDGLLIFPEGARSRNGSLGEAKAGIAAFAFSARVPVIPIFIDGTQHTLSPMHKSISLDKVKVRFGEKIYPPESFDKSQKKMVYKEFTDTVMREIARFEKDAS